jgi:exonuclease III
MDSAWRAVGIDPHLEAGVPRLPWIVGPLTGVLSRIPASDRILNALLERWTVNHLLELGYADCYRRLHDDHGYTVATWMPAARVDYVFADEAMSARLRSCAVVGGDHWPDADARAGSDHFPVVCDFAL